MAHNPITPGPTTNIAVTGTTGRLIFPTGAFNQIMVSNSGANTAFIEFGDATVAAVAATSTPVLAGAIIQVTPPGGATYVAAIGTAGTTVYFTFGNGI